MLAKAKEKWYESQVEKNRTAILRQELADAKTDMEATKYALDSLTIITNHQAKWKNTSRSQLEY
jgi:hypothetical protein